MSGITLLMLALSSTASAAAYDQFPMDTGNLWIFDTPTGHRAVVVEDTTEISAGEWASDTAGLLDASVTVYDSETSDEVTVDSSGSEALFDFGAEDGDSWDVSLSDCDNYTVTASIDADSSASTPAGDFDNIHTFELEHAPLGTACDDAPMQRIEFAEGTGPVRFVDASGQQGTLLYAEVAGDVAAASLYDTQVTGDLSVTLVVNASEADSGALTAVVLLKNLGSEDLDIALPQGTRFYVDTFEWLTGQPAGTSGSEGGAQTTLSLAPGAVQTYAAEIDLGDASGSLTLQATLNTDSVDAASPSVTIER